MKRPERDPIDTVDAVGLAVLGLFADGARVVFVERKGKGKDARYVCSGVVRKKAKT